MGIFYRVPKEDRKHKQEKSTLTLKLNSEIKAIFYDCD